MHKRQFRVYLGPCSALLGLTCIRGLTFVFLVHSSRITGQEQKVSLLVSALGQAFARTEHVFPKGG